MDPRFRVRGIADGDWEGVVALEAAAYTPLGLSEERAALESKVRASPATCFALDAGGRVAGYLLALPYPDHAVPALGRPEQAAFRSRNLHLHDLVVAEDLRGRGLGGLLVRHLAARARAAGYDRISLVAVGGSSGFWAARGFAARPGAAQAAGAGYGPESVYMSAGLTRGRSGGLPGGLATASASSSASSSASASAAFSASASSSDAASSCEASSSYEAS